MKQQFLNELFVAGIAFVVIMIIVLWQVFKKDSWLSQHMPSAAWHKKEWHYEKHEFCDGIGTIWRNGQTGQWQAIPPSLRTSFPSLGNTKKCTCKMGRMAVSDVPPGKKKQPPRRENEDGHLI
jgi:hypothetical protein